MVIFLRFDMFKGEICFKTLQLKKGKVGIDEARGSILMWNLSDTFMEGHYYCSLWFCVCLNFFIIKNIRPPNNSSSHLVENPKLSSHCLMRSDLI